MTSFLTYENIDWNKYLFIFNQFKFIQCIFIIPNEEIKNCLKIGTINLINIYDVTFNKLLNLDSIGPFITKKELTKDYNKTNLEESIIDFFIDNKYYKWYAVSDKELNCNYMSNYFKIYDKLNLKNCCFIIPHRNREETLQITKNKINSYIIKNNILADIWIIHQNNNVNWNKGTTLNIGFKILENFYDYFIFNDCDIYFENNKPFILPNEKELIHMYGHNHCMGGIFIINKQNFKNINGFCNKYFNWGREDTDLQDRLIYHKIKINRKYFNNSVTELKHSNNNNYWNFNIDTKEYFIAKKLFYFNMIEYYKKEYRNGLSNINEGNYDCNNQIIYFIKLNYYENSFLKLISGKTEIFVEFLKNEPIDIICVKYQEIIKQIPILSNHIELILSLVKENSKYYFKLTIDKLNSIVFEIENYNQNKTEVMFNNIKKEYMIKYTPFNNDTIYYSYYPKISLESYNLFVNF